MAVVNMSEESPEKGSAIPVIYYDIIARILPGALILGTYFGWEDLDSNKLGVGPNAMVFPLTGS